MALVPGKKKSFFFRVIGMLDHEGAPAPRCISAVYREAVLLGLLSGFMLLISWFSSKLFFVLFIAFVPLLSIIDRKIKPGARFIPVWLMVYVAMFIWNLENAWIAGVNMTAGLIVLFVNPVLISLPFLFLMIASKRSFLQRFLIFTTAWLFFEWLLMQWPLAFPMLTLGNGLATAPSLIQWYEYSGVAGGSLWILLVNILVYYTILVTFTGDAKPAKRIIGVAGLVVAVLIPAGLSYMIYNSFHEQGRTVEVASINTQFDCYSNKYETGNLHLVNNYLQYTLEAITSETVCVVWPETAIPQGIYRNKLNDDTVVRRIRAALKDYPHIRIITGIVLREMVFEEPNGIDVRRDTVSGCAFREFNAAIQLTPSFNDIEIKTKSRYVPVTEKLPYPEYLAFVGRAIPALAGYSFSSGRFDNALFASGGDLAIKPWICYEIAFPDVVEDKVQRPEFFCLLMNEGWYNNLRVSKRFMYLSVVRAVENRRSIVRSSNMGISGITDQRGDCHGYPVNFGTHHFNSSILANSLPTFYSKHHHFLNMLVIAAFLISLTSLLIIINPKKLKL
jgi:apolipoprotein N-acyltransferase